MSALLTLRRVERGDGWTIGRLTIRGRPEAFWTVEDKDREPRDIWPEQIEGERDEQYLRRLNKWVRSWKVDGETCIPSGLYPITWERSPRLRRHTIRLHDVPGFDGILVHAGNTASDLRGCIAPGLTRVTGGVLRSREAVEAVEGIVRPILQRGPDLIEVV